MPIWGISAASRSAWSWLFFVLPALMMNYLGQGAMILSQDMATALQTIHNPFFLLAPEMLRLPLVILATMATVIASQAVITGAFSVTQQAIQLGFIPRPAQHPHQRRLDRPDLHPAMNWGLMVMVILPGHLLPHLVQPRGGLCIAVTGAMAIDTLPDRGGAGPSVGLEEVGSRRH